MKCTSLFLCLPFLLLACTMAHAKHNHPDFKNYTYHPQCVVSLPDSGLPENITVHNGEYVIQHGKARTFFAVGHTSPAELSKDGKQHFIVSTDCGFEGANYTFQEFFFYTLEGTSATLSCTLSDDRVEQDYKKAYPDGTYWGINSLWVDKGIINILFYAEGPHCCPEFKVTARYELKRNELLLLGKPTREAVPQ